MFGDLLRQDDEVAIRDINLHVFRGNCQSETQPSILQMTGTFEWSRQNMHLS